MIHPLYYVMVLPAFLLAMWAQFRIRSAYARAEQTPARMTGAQAARHILDANGLYDVSIEMVPGVMSDHYDPRANVVRLSHGVYAGRTQAAVGIAAHEVGHALQKARNYAPLVIRNAAVPLAAIGSNSAFLLLMLGGMAGLPMLISLGIWLFAAVVFFQLVNLPVEFNASTRAKSQLVELGIVPADQLHDVRRVLTAAAMTYVAATLQAVLTLVYLVMRYSDNRD